jgi:hypothetical protein
MASSIPRERRKEKAAEYAAKNLKVAFFTEMAAYDPLTATTYTAVASVCTEVSSAGTGYTTGGYALTGKVSSYLATNGALMTTSGVEASVSNATFSARYGVIYDSATDKIEGVQDWGQTYIVTNGTIMVYPSSDGIFNIQ